MDRFKFRVWDKRLNRYLGNNDPTQMLMENGNLAYLDDEGMKFYEVEQFTGLKDKNGKLIYEGDILNSLYRSDGCEGLYRIVWCEGCLLPEKLGNHQQKQVTVHLTDLKWCEVIGNIHENKDLLGE